MRIGNALSVYIAVFALAGTGLLSPLTGTAAAGHVNDPDQTVPPAFQLEAVWLRDLATSSSHQVFIDTTRTMVLQAQVRNNGGYVNHPICFLIQDKTEDLPPRAGGTSAQWAFSTDVHVTLNPITASTGRVKVFDITIPAGYIPQSPYAPNLREFNVTINPTGGAQGCSAASKDYPENPSPSETGIPQSNAKADNTRTLKYVVNRFPDFALANISEAIPQPVAWCTHAARNSNQDSEGRYTNLSAYPSCESAQGLLDHVEYGLSRTFFWANVQNLGDWSGRTGSNPLAMEDPANPGKNLPFFVLFEIIDNTGKVVATKEYDSRPVVELGKTPFGFVSTFSDDRFDMRRMAGEFTVRVTVDPEGSLRNYLERKGTTSADAWGNHPNQVTATFRIRAPDLTGWFGAYEGDDASNPATPGKYVDIPFTIANRGDFRANRTAENANYYISYTVELDPGEPGGLTWTGVLSGLEINETVTNTIAVHVRNAASNPELNIKPGLHRLRLSIDTVSRPDARAGTHTESNETNNVIERPFYVADVTPPSLLVPSNTFRAFPQHIQDGAFRFSRGTNWYLYFDVSDDAFNFRNCATCVWTTWVPTTGGAPIRLNATANTEPGRPNEWYIENVDGSLLPVGTYDVTFHAVDPSGNQATHVTRDRFAVISGHLPVVSALAPATVPGQPRNFTFEFVQAEQSTEVAFLFNITQAGFTTGPIPLNRLTFHLTGPDHASEIPVTAKYECKVGNVRSPCTSTSQVTEIDPSTYGWVGATVHFEANRLDDVKRYVLNITVRDAGNDTHRYTYNIVYRHQHPIFDAVTVGANVTARDSLEVSTAFASTFNITKVRANVTDPQGVTRTFSLTKPASETRWQCFLTTGVDSSTQALGDLPRAGTYTVTLTAEDEHGGLNTTAPYTFRVLDVREPVIIEGSSGLLLVRKEAGVSQVEKGQNVEFVADVSDDTPVNVTLTLFKNSQKIGELAMAHKRNATFNVSVPFYEPGDYAYAFTATDSAGLLATQSGRFTVLDNMAPRVALSPGPLPQGDAIVRYIRSSTPLELTLEDSNGIDVRTLRVFVNNVRDTGFEASVTPRNCATTVCQSVKLTAVLGNRVMDNATVTLRVHVADLVGDYSNDTAFTLRVDNVGPRPILLTPLTGASPTDGQSAVINVTPATNLAFTARDDVGYVNSTIRELRVSLRAESGGPTLDLAPWRAENTVGWASRTTPIRFTKEFMDDTFLIPGRYVMTVYAVDGAGNEGNSRFVLNLIKDGPRVRFESTDEDAVRGFVNATVVDVAQLGITSVTLFYQGNGGEWRNATMVKDSNNIWHGILEAFPKGTLVRYYVAATNGLGLAGQTPTTRNFTAPNHAPEVLTFGHNFFPNPQVSGNLVLNWTVADVDGDSFTTTLRALPSLRGASPVDIALSSTPGRASVNTRAVLEDGSWTFVLRVVDAEGAASERALSVWVNNNPTAILDPRLENANLRPGENLVVTALIQKLSSDVLLEYRLKGASQWSSVPMVQVEGNLYRAELPVPQGTYDLQIVARYLGPNGQPLEEAYPLPALTVEATAADILGGNAALWVGILALTGVALGVGGYALKRRWK